MARRARSSRWPCRLHGGDWIVPAPLLISANVVNSLTLDQAKAIATERVRRPAGDRPHSARAILLFFLIASVLIFAKSMGKDLDVDENPFIASGAVLARHGTLPYRDYHYNHMPTEVIVYAGLFRVTDHLLLAARAFQSTCAAGAATLLFAVALGAAREWERRRRVLFAIAIGLLLLTNPIFTQTSGISWNHDFPLLMALLGFVTLRRGLQGQSPQLLAATSGFLVAIAATSRLTFLPVTAGFVLVILLYPQLPSRRRAALLGLLVLGFSIGALPSLWIWSRAWQNAFFGNFLYPRLNTEIHAQRDGYPLYTFWQILGWYLKTWITLPGNGLVTVAFLALMAAMLRPLRVGKDAIQSELLAIFAIAALMIASGFMPAPPYPQYFYAATPFMILGLAIALASSHHLLADRRLQWIAAASVIFCVAMGAPVYWHVVNLASPNRWVPMQVHETSREIAQKLGTGEPGGAGTVLTIEPVFAVEGGLDIDPRLVTGRFGLRVADLLTAAQRQQYLMPAPQDISLMFDGRQPPHAVLIVRGTDGRLDHLFRDEALRHGYREVRFPGKGGHGARDGFAWLRPDSRDVTPPSDRATRTPTIAPR